MFPLLLSYSSFISFLFPPFVNISFVFSCSSPFYHHKLSSFIYLPVHLSYLLIFTFPQSCLLIHSRIIHFIASSIHPFYVYFLYSSIYQPYIYILVIHLAHYHDLALVFPSLRSPSSAILYYCLLSLLIHPFYLFSPIYLPYVDIFQSSI